MASSEVDNKMNRKKQESVRERAERVISEASKPKKKVKNVKKTEEVKRAKPEKKHLLSKSRKSDSKKDKKTRRFHIVPRFITQAFAEIKLVTWPDARQTYRLTVAVILFAVVFAIFISIVDYAFSIVFKRVFLHG